ncbi:MAG: SLBB domain-containing protein [Bacteroidetes bacterium]|nr:SLBB domain-containing protein [Candidatus Colenecus caballi]
MKKLLLTLFVLLPLAVYGQSATMMSMAQAELQKRGLNETEVRNRPLSEGIDVDNISPADYAGYQDRVLAILDQMQAEKAAKAAPAAAAGNDFIAAAVPEQIAQTTSGEAAAEAALQENMGTVATGNIYGHSLFTNKSLDVFRTTDGAQAPDTYVLGEGDEVHISIFGSSQTEIHQRVGANGSIQPAGSSKIFLRGMTLAQAREAVRKKLASHYSFRPDQIAVTISTARTMTVSIYGEVGVAGGFTVSALNTAFNALAAAGGPTEIGSVRNIQLSRGGKTSTLDLYKYMNGTGMGSFDLQNGDIMFVPVAQKLVSIEGSVIRPMRYEMVDGETVRDLIDYAGGLKYNVYPEYLQVERMENGEKRYIEYNLNSVMNGTQRVDLANGDIVRVREASKPIENYVAIEGAVFYGGNYDLETNSSLKALIDKAQLKYTAKTNFAFVERTRPDETVEFLTVPFPGENGNPDFQLQGRDKVRITEQADYRDVAQIEVRGQVRDPFTRTFGLNDRMTVTQAIEYAGGLKPSVFPVAYISRKDLTNPSKMEYISISLDKDGDTLLQPGDKLEIYDNTTFTNVGEVRVSGAVKSPFGTTYDASLSVHDMLTMAGGFEVGAAYDRVEVFRVNIDDKDEAKLDLITLKVDEDYNTLEDFQLQPYDHIVVRMTPNFTMGRTVEISGRVKYPGQYVLEDNKTQLWEIIEMAGGLLDDADPYARLFRTYNNRGNIGLDLREVKSSKGKVKSDPILMDGDVINIVRLENTVLIRETGTRMAQYVPEEYSATQKLMIYQGKHSAKWYVKHYAGGFQKLADKNSVTVTFPNNQTESTKRHLGFIRKYPTVEPGGVITMRFDEDKRERLETPKEKINWGQTLNSSVSTLTSVFSLIILVDRLK